MRFAANEKTLPRLHLIGTLGIVLLLTLALGGYFSWRSAAQHQESLQRMVQTVQAQQQARLTAELDSVLNFLDFTRSRTEAQLRKSLRQQVDSAMQVAQAIFDAESHRRSTKAVTQLIIAALRPVRFFDGRGYYFIDSMQGQFVLLPTAPQFEGKTMPDNRDDTGHLIMQGLIEAARKPVDASYSRYRWYLPDKPEVMADKLAYVRYFAPFDWLIGTGDYTALWEQDQQQQVLERLRTLKFGRSGHFGVLDRDGRTLLPLAGHRLDEQLDPQAPEAAASVLAQLLAKAQAGGGFVSYAQPLQAGSSKVNQTALVRLVEPWGWVVVAAMQNNEMQNAVQQELTQNYPSYWQRSGEWLLPLALALTLGLLASLVFARWSHKVFTIYHQELTQKNKMIADSESLFHAVFDHAAVGIAQVAPSGEFWQVNQHFCDLIGYPREELLVTGFSFQRITQPDDLEEDMVHVNRLLQGQTDQYRLEKRYVRKDGQIVWVDLSVHLMREATGKPHYFISVIHDISARKQAEHSLQLAASVFSHAREGIMITDVNGSIINVNDSFTRITGYTRDEALGQNPRILKSGRQPVEYYANMWDNLNAKGHWYGEVWNRRKNGEVYAEMQTISAVHDTRGAVAHFVSLFTDITALKMHEQQLERMAHFDALTGLPNRALLADRLHQAMHNMQRRDQLLAVAYLDLDGFKQVNDREGHDAGDQLLMAASNRMKLALREGDTLARIGGDEFVAVLVDLPDVSACVPLLTRLLAAAAEPLVFEGKTLQVSASLGVTFYPQADEMDADQLQRQADQAMYQAKLAGKNRYHVFDAAQDRTVRDQHQSLERIRQALNQGELVLYYQPKVNLRSGQVVGAEALIRWQHPQRGLLLPGLFLPAIENHSLAIDVGEWVMHTALQQISDWRAQGFDLPVSINVGARQLQQRDFVARFEIILAQHPEVEAACLTLEVLETSAIQDIAGVIEVIDQCRSLGVLFALDDFGTGYSSLTYLKRLPVALLKIDQSFVRDMLKDPDDLAILQAVIGLAQAFKHEVIAEGVETIAHGTALLQQGCELAQGFGISRPMPASELPVWADTWQPDAAWASA